MNTGREYYHIHGDNIVECERTLRLVELALADECQATDGPHSSATNPVFELVLPRRKKSLVFTFFCGFGRWDYDIRHLIRDSGGTIREAPDVILSEVTSGREVPLVAIEYSGALAAGNQAWQRNGRAYSLGLARVPFLYVAELGGYELDAARIRRSPRLPNPAVAFSYLSFTSSMNTPVLPVLVPNPGVDDVVRKHFAAVIGEEELVEFVRVTILKEDAASVTRMIEGKALTFVRQLASRRSGTLSADQWSKVYREVKAGGGGALVSFLLRETAQRWSKTAYITQLTDTAKQLMRIAAQLGIGLTSKDLPICLIPPENRPGLANHVQGLHPSVGSDFVGWLGSERPLAICWVMGFKPRGDDARPDRGLPPLARMLIGPNVDMLTVVYGPAPELHWSLLMESPISLAQRNGLWEAIMAASDAILADSATDRVTSHGFLRTQWESKVTATHLSPMLVTPTPVHIGENDVDTVIHSLFSRLGTDGVFEGFCNPPGGDWSGISLLTHDMSIEMRWLSLPRVSGTDTKRPDHVLEIFTIRDVPVILAIESKETPHSVEAGIGPRLSAYMSNLVRSIPSIERDNTEGARWRQSEYSSDSDSFLYASGSAFLIANARDIASVAKRANADLQIGLRFSDHGRKCEVHLLPSTELGVGIIKLVERLPLSNAGLSVHVHQ